MATNTVNMDAMIIRSDMADDPTATKPGAQSRTTLSILDLDGGFFATGLRKPDFQRETTHWNPQKIVDLISAFVRGDLIPAVILWQRGADTFVIDGAHRLSALLAWIHDDYGDRSKSTAFFGAQIPPEQLAIAEKTRKEVSRAIGPYSYFKGLAASRAETSPENKRVIEGLSNNSLIVQWVPANDAKSAEKSFFKINQAAQPIDPTEKRILQARDSANAIAARCLVRGGQGHKYWSEFEGEKQKEIEALGTEIYDALFRPPIEEPITTLDLPVAGRGYNQLPFAFDFVNLCNEIPVPERAEDKRIMESHGVDKDGDQTIAFLKAVKKRTRMITTKDPGSLGLHPAVYFYAMSGTFMPNAFLAAAEFVRRMADKKKLDAFTTHRRAFEDYLFENKIFITLTVTKLGSAGRSLGRLSDLLWRVFELFEAGKTPDEISDALFADPNFHHLIQAKSPPPRTTRGKTGKMSGTTKSAVMLRDGYASVRRCAICNAAVHFRSTSIDHIERRRDGGNADMSNGQVTHPYCNHGYKERKIANPFAVALTSA